MTDDEAIGELREEWDRQFEDWVDRTASAWEREARALIAQGGGAGHGMLRCAAELRARAAERRYEGMLKRIASRPPAYWIEKAKLEEGCEIGAGVPCPEGESMSANEYGKELYRVTVAVNADPELSVICREYVEARGDEDAEREALSALERRWQLHALQRGTYEVRAIERGRFVEAS